MAVRVRDIDMASALPSSGTSSSLFHNIVDGADVSVDGSRPFSGSEDRFGLPAMMLAVPVLILRKRIGGNRFWGSAPALPFPWNKKGYFHL
jgi:hypothetical protein